MGTAVYEDVMYRTLTVSANSLVVATVATSVMAQSVLQLDKSRQFDVASVKRNTSLSESMRFPVPSNGRFVVENIPLKVLIAFAFGVQGETISGDPAWFASAKYDVTANAARPDLTRDDYRLMLQTLLIERFGLVTHWEQRDRQGFALFVDKRGLKLVVASAPCAEPGTPSDRAVVTCGTFFTGPESLDARKMSTAQFASTLSMVLGAPVIDRTGAIGLYDIHLEFNPEGTNLTGRGTGALETPLNSANRDTDKPSIFGALQQQVGLRLESVKVQTNVLVIDHVERLAEN